MSAPGDGETTELVRPLPGEMGVLLARILPELHAVVRLQLSPAVRAHEESDDVVQSVCREVMVDLAQAGAMDEVTLRAWVFQAVRRKVADKSKYWLRERRDVRREAVLPEGASGSDDLPDVAVSIIHPGQRVLDRELARMMEGWFDRLSPEEQEAIALCNVLRLPIRQAAAEVGVSADAMKQRVSRARRKLWQMYARWEDGRESEGRGKEAGGPVR